MSEDITQHNTEEIRKNYGKIKKGLIVDDVIDQLIDDGVVSIEKWHEIKRSDKDKVEEVLQILWNKPRVIPIFHKALKNNNHESLAALLKIKDNPGEPEWNTYFLFYFTYSTKNYKQCN